MALARTLLQPRALQLLSWGTLGIALFFVGATGLFVLDARQVGEGIPEMSRSAFQVGAVRAVVKLILVAGAMGWLGVAGLRSLRHPDR